MKSSEPPRYPLILNPKAKGERARRTWQFVQEYATRFVIHATRSRQESVELARALAARGEPIVAAAGGDGTLNAVVEGLAGSQTTLGVFPTGTMNVFAREMGIHCQDLQKALAILDSEERCEVDLFQMNEAPFLQMAGVGFDAKVIEETTWASKKRLGPFSYLMTAARLLRDRPPVLELSTGSGEKLEGVFALIGNGALYGGQFKMFQAASNRDAKLDVIVFRKLGLDFLLNSVTGLARGGIGPDFPAGSVRYLQTELLDVRCEEEVPVELDGELWGRAGEIRFRRAAEALRVCAPGCAPQSGRLELLRSLKPW